MSGKFEMHLIVPAKLVGPIVELVEGEGVVVTMNPHVDKSKSRKSARYVDGKKNKGISGSDAALQVMETAGRPLTAVEIGNLIFKHGFSAKTASPVMSQLLRNGRVVKDDAHRYSLRGGK